MKKYISIVITVLLLTLSIRCVQADTLSSLSDSLSRYNANNKKDGIYVDDDANLLSEEEENSLNDRLAKLSSNYGIDFVIHTSRTTNGKTSERYADDYYEQNGYRKNGILLLMDMKNEYMYITTSGQAVDLFTDYGLNAILDSISDDVKRGKYYNAFSRFADKAERVVIEGRKGNVIDTNNTGSFGFGNLGLSAFFGAISSFISTAVMKGKLKTVSRNRYARNYIVDNSFELTGYSDMLVDKKVSRRKKSTDDKHGSKNRGEGSTIHVSSSGTVHGGQGKHF